MTSRPLKKGSRNLATLKRHLPFAQDILVVLLGPCAVPIYSWAMLVFFEHLRAWLFYLNVWEVTGILAHHLLFAALESLALVLALFLLAALLPRKWLRDRFVSLGGMAALLSAGMTIVTPLTKTIPLTFPAQRHLFRTALVWAAYVVLLGLSVLLIHRCERVERAVRSFVIRTTILGVLYAVLTSLSLAVIVIRVV